MYLHRLKCRIRIKPRVMAEQVKDYLEKLDAFKLSGPDGMYPRILE